MGKGGDPLENILEVREDFSSRGDTDLSGGNIHFQGGALPRIGIGQAVQAKRHGAHVVYFSGGALGVHFSPRSPVNQIDPVNSLAMAGVAEVDDRV